MNQKLLNKKCLPCGGGVPPLSPEQQKELLSELTDWQIVNSHHLEKSFRFTDNQAPLTFVNQVWELANKEGHHPDLHLTCRTVNIKIHTHKIDGLSEADFVLAAKIDNIK